MYKEFIKIFRAITLIIRRMIEGNNNMIQGKTLLFEFI